MSDTYDDMPEIELDDIVAPNGPPLEDDEAIELDLELQPVKVAPEAARQEDEDAIDLGLDLDFSPSAPVAEDEGPSPLDGIDVDALASHVARTSPPAEAVNLHLAEERDSPFDTPDFALDDLGAAAAEPVAPVPVFSERPATNSAAPAVFDGAAVDLDELLGDIDTGLPANDSAPAKIQSSVEALPDIDDDALSALNVDLEESEQPLNVDEANPSDDGGALSPFDDGPAMIDGGAPTVESPALASVSTMEIDASDLDNEDADAEVELELDPRLTGEHSPRPLLEALPDLSNEPASTSETFLRHESGQLAFEAEHAPIADKEDDEVGEPMIIAPVDDPDAPPLPLSGDEPPGRPKVPLDQLVPDPKTIETLKRLAGPGGDPERARIALLAAFRGEGYDPKALPDGRDIAVGLGRFLVQQGHDADALAETIVAVMLE